MVVIVVMAAMHGCLLPLRSFPRKRESSGSILIGKCAFLGPRFRGDERLGDGPDNHGSVTLSICSPACR